MGDQEIINAINSSTSKSFGQNGGIILNILGTVETTVEEPKVTYCCFLPDDDGTFDISCKSNLQGLGGSSFSKGIPKYFIATYIKISAGSGTLYKS